LGVHREPNSQSGNSLGNVKVHSLTLSYTPRSMLRDSQTSFLAHNLASPCLGCEPKARVAATKIISNMQERIGMSLVDQVHTLDETKKKKLKHIRYPTLIYWIY